MGVLKPICVPCGLFFRPEKNGICFEEGLGDGTATSYKIWYGDKWKCRGCGAEVIVGSGDRPIAIRHLDDYEETRSREAPELMVDDC